MVAKSPELTLNSLNRTDGSASYSSNGYTVICGINGPIEVQKRDELPEEAAIDVNIRPYSGVGGVRERHLESIVHSTLRQIIHVSTHPRTLIQVTLQVVASPEDESQLSGPPQAASCIDVLPALFQAAMLALLTTSIPLVTTMASASIAIDDDGSIKPNPTGKDLNAASSIHVLAFSSQSDLLVGESQGEFDMEEWETVYAKALDLCIGARGDQKDGDDMSMDAPETRNLHDVLRDAVQTKVDHEQRWKQSLD